MHFESRTICPRYVNYDCKKKQRIVVIGTGPTGLGAVHRLHQLGTMNSNTQVIVLEKESKPGGLASSVRDEKGFLWDMGGHVVFSHYIHFDTVLNEAMADWNQHTRASFAFMKGSDGKHRFIPYPVQDNIHLMDETDREISLKGLEEVISRDEKPANFDQWLLWNFGEGLCNIFMRKYNRKVWTVDPREMNSVWVGERVAVPNVKQIKSKIASLGKEEALKDSAWGPNRFFRFPRYSGTGGIWGNVTARLPHGLFHFEQRVISIDIQKKRLEIEPKSYPALRYHLEFDHLISTVPLDLFLKMINKSGDTSNKVKTLADQFVYSHTHIIGIGLRGQPPKSLADKSWMYFPDDDAPFYRITVFSSYSDDHVPEPGSYWSLMCEAAEPKETDDRDRWSKEVLIDRTIKALINFHFITSNNIVSKFYHRLERGYPVPFLERENLLGEIQPWLESNRVYSRGRFGGWRYEVGNQDHSFMQGVEIADFIMNGYPEDTYPNPNKVNSKKNDKRVSVYPPNPPVDQQFEIVVSHYDEDLTWLDSVSSHCHVYHKGKEVRPRYNFKQWEKLPNVGRESHTYLQHIVNNYYHLADVTAFVQGSVNEHSEYCFRNLFEYFSKSLKNGVGYKMVYALNQIDMGWFKHFGHWEEDYNSGNMQHAKYTFRGFYKTAFGKSAPSQIDWVPSACFSATRERIKQHPLEFYIKLLSFVDNHPNPEEGHYFERLWVHMFS